jgi:hypothetical protein
MIGSPTSADATNNSSKARSIRIARTHGCTRIERIGGSAHRSIDPTERRTYHSRRSYH